MLTTQKIKQIKEIYLDPTLKFKEVLEKSRRIYGKRIAYTTLLQLMKIEGVANRKSQKIRYKAKCGGCKHPFEVCICAGVAHG